MATKKPKSDDAPEATMEGAPFVVKKYANRRLYDTKTSTYVTLNDLAEMARAGEEFIVQDARTGEDLTHSVLVQIILECEAQGENLLPLSFLRRIAGLYGDSLRWAVPSYLDSAMDVFLRNQNALREHVNAAFTDNPAMAGLEQVARINHEIFSRTVRMFTSLNGAGVVGTNVGESAPAEKDSEMEELRKQMATMQRQLDKLSTEN